MAPSAVETITEAPPVAVGLKALADEGNYKQLAPKFNEEVERNGNVDHAPATYPHYLPTWDREKTYPSLTPFEHHDVAHEADPSYPELLGEGVTITHLTASIGSEVRGIQLSKLSAAGRAELALLVAKRKVVAFRDQDFVDQSIPEALEFGSTFGRHHIHPTSGVPEGYPEIQIVHRSAGDRTIDEFFTGRTNSVSWHSDVSYEAQPPGTTFLSALDLPSTGGDTLFANAAEAYERLSDGFKERLHGLKATHSAVEQANASKNRGGISRREPVINAHPIVRTHPVTGEKALYINPQFTRSIVGYKKEESDALLKFLYEHIAYGADFQVRVKWEKGTVVAWDNRVTQHSALVDWKTGERRHLARITPQAERPFETPFKA
ncbi:related to E.coli dioxygenase [Cephalotrichum gorgonifer]|uniref:Related to E.coli dioxygenase n=1 Tax=Cephalotrichum gorgonifer TaxID=2041049 RepID=A0AAE8SQI0_9PEZI|nr:related to E.coli dioxygenase [Cephalotrichum gorgonifer]